MPTPNPPFSTVTLHLKQLSMERTNSLGRAAMEYVFGGFAREKPVDQATIDAWVAKKSTQQTGVADFMYDPTHYRRFSGDGSLGRSRYSALADDSSGSDGGTMKAELREYYHSESAGFVQFFDSTEPRDAWIFDRVERRYQHQLSVFFPIVRGRPNAFAVKHFPNTDKPPVILLPLVVRQQKLERVIDLRVPSVADWVAREFSRVEWEGGVKCFPHRQPLDDFEALIPGLMEQALGGSSLTNALGLWLRRIGAQGLVYPSARVDPEVVARDGHVQSARGFCFVDYRDAGLTAYRAIIEDGAEWPRHVQISSEGPGRDGQPIVFHGVKIDYQRSGAERGSWSVNGIRDIRILLWYSKQAHAVSDTVLGPRPDLWELRLASASNSAV